MSSMDPRLRERILSSKASSAIRAISSAVMRGARRRRGRATAPSTSLSGSLFSLPTPLARSELLSLEVQAAAPSSTSSLSEPPPADEPPTDSRLPTLRGQFNVDLALYECMDVCLLGIEDHDLPATVFGLAPRCRVGQEKAESFQGWHRSEERVLTVGVDFLYDEAAPHVRAVLVAFVRIDPPGP